jgi:hypothetical protein
MQEQPCAAFKAMGAMPYSCRKDKDECQCLKIGIIKLPPAKPVVHFSGYVSSIAIGQRAFVMPLDHPSDLVSNSKIAMTSIVQSFVSNNGVVESFETENTCYVKACV